MRRRLANETRMIHGVSVHVEAEYWLDVAGFPVIEMRAQCGDCAVVHRQTIGGVESHPLAEGFDAAQIERDLDAAIAWVAAIAESRQRAALLVSALAARRGAVPAMPPQPPPAIEGEP